MASHNNHAQSALSAAGIVGLWEIDVDAGTANLDLESSRFFYGDDRFADIPVSLSDMFAQIHEEDVSSVAALFSEKMRLGGPLVLEYRISLTEHGPRRVQARGTFARDQRGRMVGRGIFIDLSRHETEDRSQGFALRTYAPTAAPSADPLAKAAEHGVELRKALGRSGHSSLRLAADLLLWEINTAAAAQLTVSHKDVPALRGVR